MPAVVANRACGAALGRVSRPEVTLRIVGEFWEGRPEIERQIADLGLGDRVGSSGAMFSDQEAAECFNAADVVVLPYRTVTASGVMSGAYRYGRQQSREPRRPGGGREDRLGTLRSPMWMPWPI